MVRSLDPPPPDFRLLQLSTDGLPARERFDLWRDVVTRKLLRMSVDSLTDAPFKADAMLRSQHGLTIGIGELGPSINRRTGEIVSNDNDDLVLLANLAGPFIAASGTSELTLGPGDAILVSCGQTGNFVRPATGKLLCVRIPRRALEKLAPEPEGRTGRIIPSSSGALRMLMAYSGALWDPTTAVEPDVSKFVVDHLCDLVALCAGARGDAAEFAAERGGRAARLRAVKDNIEQRIGPQELSIEDVAADVGVSARYVRKLFESEGASFSSFVTERRLARARAMLTSPRYAGLTVATVAFDVGFGDLSYFNRTFRRVYDRTPSEVRAERV